MMNNIMTLRIWQWWYFWTG